MISDNKEFKQSNCCNALILSGGICNDCKDNCVSIKQEEEMIQFEKDVEEAIRERINKDREQQGEY